MIGEFDVAGVFIPAIVVWAIISMAIGIIIRQILTAIRFYQLVWHRGLFDLALFFILWATVAFTANFYGLAAGLSAGIEQ